MYRPPRRFSISLSTKRSLKEEREGPRIFHLGRLFRSSKRASLNVSTFPLLLYFFSFSFFVTLSARTTPQIGGIVGKIQSFLSQSFKFLISRNRIIKNFLTSSTESIHRITLSSPHFTVGLARYKRYFGWSMQRTTCVPSDLYPHRGRPVLIYAFPPLPRCGAAVTFVIRENRAAATCHGLVGWHRRVVVNRGGRYFVDLSYLSSSSFS